MTTTYLRTVAAISILAGVLALLSGCAGTPELTPEIPSAPPASSGVQPMAEPVPPAPEPVPQAEPELPAAPDPVGHAPLVGTRWTLTRLYGDMRRLVPPSRDVWIELRRPADRAGDGPAAEALVTGSGPIYVQGPSSTIEGEYQFRVNIDSPRESLTYEEGRVTGASITRDRRAGSFDEFEDMLLDNLGLLKGYYIEGATPEESRLTIWGGYLSEEVVLMELEATIPATGM